MLTNSKEMHILENSQANTIKWEIIQVTVEFHPMTVW